MFGFALFSLLLAGASASDSVGYDDQCAAALSYLAVLHPEARSDGTVVYGVRPANVFPAGMADTAWFDHATNEPREAPSIDLRAKLFLHNLSAVDTCPTVRAFLKSHRIKFGKSAVKAAEWDQRTKRRRAYIRFISLPALGPDSHDAVLGMEGDGGTWSVYLRRQSDGSWKTSAYAPGMVF